MKAILIVIIAETFIAGEPVKASDKLISMDEDTGRLLIANHKARRPTEAELAKAEAEAAEAAAKAEAEAAEAAAKGKKK